MFAGFNMVGLHSIIFNEHYYSVSYNSFISCSCCLKL